MSVVTLLSWEFFLLLDPAGSSQIADGQGTDQEAQAVNEQDWMGVSVVTLFIPE